MNQSELQLVASCQLPVQLSGAPWLIGSSADGTRLIACGKRDDSPLIVLDAQLNTVAELEPTSGGPRHDVALNKSGILVAVARRSGTEVFSVESRRRVCWFPHDDWDDYSTGAVAFAGEALWTVRVDDESHMPQVALFDIRTATLTSTASGSLAAVADEGPFIAGLHIHPYGTPVFVSCGGGQDFTETHYACHSRSGGVSVLRHHQLGIVQCFHPSGQEYVCFDNAGTARRIACRSRAVVLGEANLYPEEGEHDGGNAVAGAIKYVSNDSILCYGEDSAFVELSIKESSRSASRVISGSATNTAFDIATPLGTHQVGAISSSGRLVLFECNHNLAASADSGISVELCGAE